jgi:hypothetical protein
MDAFESVIATILEHRGYWVRSSYKIDLSKAEKAHLGKPSLPRPELDLVAYKGQGNVIRVVECKSYLDSAGVSISAFNGTNEKSAERFKLLLRDEWRELMERRLIEQMCEAGLTERRPSVLWCLAAGKVKSAADEVALSEWFAHRGWEFWGPGWVAEGVRALACGSYENDVATIVSKLIVRQAKSAHDRLGT